jgi:hypothetical protein
MAPPQDRLTLDALLSDPLTQLVMRSDGITARDVAEAFAMAQAGLPAPARQGASCTTFDRWVGQGMSCRAS